MLAVVLEAAEAEASEGATAAGAAMLAKGAAMATAEEPAGASRRRKQRRALAARDHDCGELARAGALVDRWWRGGGAARRWGQ